MTRCKGLWLGVLGLLLLFCPAQLFCQPADCTQKELEGAALPQDAPGHGDAIALAATLNKKGITVRCILGSTMEDTFDGQTGAAVFRTDRGSFEVLFLPPPQTFDHLRVIERRDGKRYLYRFKGPPQPWPANLIDSAFPIFFIKSRNMLFVVESDAALRATVEKFVRPEH